MSLVQERVHCALIGDDIATLQERYDEICKKLFSRALCTTDDLLQRVGKGINKSINAESFIPDYAKNKESHLIALR